MVSYVEVSLDGCMNTTHILSKELFLVDHMEMEFTKDWKLVDHGEGMFVLYLYGRPIKRSEYDDNEYRWISEHVIYTAKTGSKHINKYPHRWWHLYQ
jgi:hypothetical protein